MVPKLMIGTGNSLFVFQTGDLSLVYCLRLGLGLTLRIGGTFRIIKRLGHEEKCMIMDGCLYYEVGTFEMGGGEGKGQLFILVILRWCRRASAS